MKKTLALLLALCMTLSLCACGKRMTPPQEAKAPKAARTRRLYTLRRSLWS